MELIKFLFLVIVVLFTSCQKQNIKTIKTFPNGDKQIVAEFNKNGDTICKIYYHENGVIKATQPYNNNLINGIIRGYYSDGIPSEEMVMLNGISLYLGVNKYNLDNIKTSIIYYEHIRDTTFVSKGNIKYNPDRSINKDESIFYTVCPKNDTISVNGTYKFHVDVIARGREKVFTEIVLGKLNNKMEVVDTLTWQGKWSKSFDFSIKPEKKGYNYVLGKLVIITMYPELNNHGVDTLLFYKDFYVE